MSHRLCIAACDGDARLVGELIREGADPNASSYIDPNEVSCDLFENPGPAPPIVFAAYKNRLDVARMLVSAGARVDGRGDDRLTALMWADTPAMVEFSIRSGAGVNAVNGEGATPLICLLRGAADRTSTKELIDAGADVNACTDDGGTALMLAAERQDISNVSALLAAGANVNLTDSSGRSALIESAYDGAADPDIVQCLIRYGADTALRDGTGKTALDYTRTYSDGINVQVTRLLARLPH